MPTSMPTASRRSRRIAESKNEEAEGPPSSGPPSEEGGNGKGEGRDRDHEEEAYEAYGEEMAYDPHDQHWVAKSKELSGLLRYGKHKGRTISLQVNGWCGASDLAFAMSVP